MARSHTAGRPVLLTLAVLLAAGIVLALSRGDYPIPPGQVAALLWSPSPDLAASDVVWSIRLPRIAAAVLTGASLAAAGAAYQTLFRNPLASPALLGVSSGAGFGAALAMLAQASALVVQSAAFAGGLAAVTLALALSNRLGRGSILILILSGLVISALFQAFTSGLKYLADPQDTLPAIVFWLLGSLARATSHDLVIAAPPALCGLVLLMLLRWPTQVIEAGDDEARTLGVRVNLVRLLVIAAATLATAAAVSVAGVVGWIGLLVPHLARLLVGAAYPLLLPASMLLGALFLVAVDTLCRTAFPIELPLGIVTAILGAPLFIAILIRAKRTWS